MSLTIPAVIWVAMAVVTGALALYRKLVSNAEVDVIHLREAEVGAIGQQVQFAHKLDAIDKWGKILTITLIAYGLVLACGYLVMAWQQSSQQVN